MAEENHVEMMMRKMEQMENAMRNRDAETALQKVQPREA